MASIDTIATFCPPHPENQECVSIEGKNTSMYQCSKDQFHDNQSHASLTHATMHEAPPWM
eukprot:541797-Pyramimonas_sp.AAC.1